MLIGVGLLKFGRLNWQASGITNSTIFHGATRSVVAVVGYVSFVRTRRRIDLDSSKSAWVSQNYDLKCIVTC